MDDRTRKETSTVFNDKTNQEKGKREVGGRVKARNERWPLWQDESAGESGKEMTQLYFEEDTKGMDSKEHVQWEEDQKRHPSVTS